MWELYLINRIGMFHNLCVPVAVLGCIIAIIIFFCSITTDDWDGSLVFGKSQEQLRKNAKRFFIIGLLGILGVVFIPDTKEAYVIYGVGNTIDYLKNNETAKQLPDKAIQALDKWADKFLTEEEND